jgi:hypothetical protein
LRRPATQPPGEGEAFAALDAYPSSFAAGTGDGSGVARPDDQTPTASARQHEIHVRRIARARYVLQVGDEVRTCAERDLPDALRQALGLGLEDARVLAETLRADARRRDTKR